MHPYFLQPFNSYAPSAPCHYCKTYLIFKTLTKVVESGCHRPRLKNGKARVYARGSRVRYRCRGGFSLFGTRFSVCINNRWSHPEPTCVCKFVCTLQTFSRKK